MDRVQLEGGNSAVYSSPTGFHLGPGMHTWSQEFNLISPEGQRLEWLVGGYRNDRHTELHLNIGLSNPNSSPPLSCGWEYDGTWTPCPTTGERTTALYWQSFDDVIHSALFGQLNFDLTDTVELTFELRQNDDDNTQLRYIFVPALPAPGIIPGATEACPGQVPNEPTLYCPPGVYTNIEPTVLLWDDTQTTGKVGVNWEPRDGHFLYAFFARGYKSGQSTIPGTEPIVAEVVDDIEIGWKGTLADGSLYAELGLYRMDYGDMQVGALRITALDSRQGVTNAGDSIIQGVEGSLRWLAPGGFGVDASFAYTDSELGDILAVDTRALPFNPTFSAPGPGDVAQGCSGPLGVLPGQCFDFSPYTQVLSGREGPLSPKLTYNLSLDYAFELRNGGTITPRVSLNHSDASYTNILQSNLDRYYYTDERDVVNFSLTYNKDDWDVQLFATNITDETYIEGADTSGNAVLYGDPRVVGVRARMGF
jgi:outer membrane receptor protein involved in Fe transport